jgi:hypothetical protein
MLPRLKLAFDLGRCPQVRRPARGPRRGSARAAAPPAAASCPSRRHLFFQA